jgi:hypothetical protein
LYVGSTYAITQELTSLVVEEFEHSFSRGDKSGVDQSCKELQNGFPKYWQANPKPATQIHLPHAVAVDRAPQIPIGSFISQTVSLKSLPCLESVLSRAPPMETTGSRLGFHIRQ